MSPAFATSVSFPTGAKNKVEHTHKYCYYCCHQPPSVSYPLLCLQHMDLQCTDPVGLASHPLFEACRLRFLVAIATHIPSGHASEQVCLMQLHTCSPLCGKERVHAVARTLAKSWGDGFYVSCACNVSECQIKNRVPFQI